MLLSTKLRNQIKKELERKGKSYENYEIILKNTLINGSKRGCYGFVKKNTSNVVVYVNTEKSVYAPLADKNLALEINTAGLRREIGQTSPTLEYVKLFRKLGGELLTFGSDAHRAQDLGAGLDVAIDMAKEAGFSHFAFYKKREPRMLRLM